MMLLKKKEVGQQVKDKGHGHVIVKHKIKYMCYDGCLKNTFVGLNFNLRSLYQFTVAKG